MMPQSAPIQPKPSGSDPQTPLQETNWSDFRDHLATAEKDGQRKWIFPRKPQGRYYRVRTWVSWLLLAIMFAGPFVRINGNPLLLFNIVERRFSILGQLFWPQDMAIFAVATLLFLTSIIIFTTAFGRLWCGWTCPQTLLMEMVFRKIEYLIEGDASAQRALRAAPWSARKLLLKTAKHGIFFALSFVIGNTLLSYIIGSEKLLLIIADNPLHHLRGLILMILFTLIFYAIFARFREQACTFICPYGRFQSTMLDENTLLVAYDYKRGEHRAKLTRSQTWPKRQELGAGDCVNCRQCVNVCPTGIDIRDGVQMECVNCTACMDACDAVMTKIGRPRGLIRYASLNSIEKGDRFRFTPRLAGYTALIALLAGLLGFLIYSRSNVQTTLLRAPGGLFQKTAAGALENLYTVKFLNKSSRPVPVELRLEDLAGKLTVMNGPILVIPREEMATTSLLVETTLQNLKEPATKFHVGVYVDGKRIDRIRTVFIGPRDGSIPGAK